MFIWSHAQHVHSPESIPILLHLLDKRFFKEIWCREIYATTIWRFLGEKTEWSIFADDTSSIDSERGDLVEIFIEHRG